MNTQTKALVLNDDLRSWLEEHGLELRWMKRATINIGANAKGARVWLDAEFYKLNEDGNLYLKPGGVNEAVTGFISVPLKSWPPLTLVDAE